MRISIIECRIQKGLQNQELVGKIFTLVGDDPSNRDVGNGKTSQNAFLNIPQWLEYDSQENLFISDTGNNRIAYWNKNTLIVESLVGTGSADPPTPEGLLGNQTTLNFPVGLVFSNQTNTLYFADSLHYKIRGINLNTKLVFDVAGKKKQFFFSIFQLFLKKNYFIQ